MGAANRPRFYLLVVAMVRAAVLTQYVTRNYGVYGVHGAARARAGTRVGARPSGGAENSSYATQLPEHPLHKLALKATNRHQLVHTFLDPTHPSAQFLCGMGSRVVKIPPSQPTTPPL